MEANGNLNSQAQEITVKQAEVIDEEEVKASVIIQEQQQQQQQQSQPPPMHDSSDPAIQKSKQPLFVTQYEKIQEALRLKDEGNMHFKNKNYKKALTCYNKVFLFVNGLVTKDNECFQYATKETKLEDPEKMNQVKELQCLTYLNMAQIDLINKNYDKAVDRASKSLQIGETVKGYFRRACAWLEKGDLLKCRSDLEKAKEIDPAYQEIDVKFKELKQKEREVDKELQGKLKKMFL